MTGITIPEVMPTSDLFPDGKSLITLTESEWEKVRPSTSKIPDLRIHAVSFARCHSKVEAINRVATAARAPEYFGENLDALHDILRDRPAGIDLFELRHAEQLDPFLRAGILSVFADLNPEDRYGPGRAVGVEILPNLWRGRKPARRR